MRYPNILFLAVLLGVTAAGPVLGAGETDTLKPLADDTNRCAMDLYSRLKAVDGNLFFSPFSISTALAMTYGGARGNTAAEMAETLYFTGEPMRLHSGFHDMNQWLETVQSQGHVTLSTANSLWPQKDYVFLAEYLDLVKRYYGVGVTPVDYVSALGDAVRRINTWVEGQTNDKIQNLLSPGSVSPMTRMILVNAIYFLGNWQDPFEEKLTGTHPFHLLDGTTRDAPLMYRKGHYRYMATATFQMVELPYKGRDIAMLVLLPKETDGITALEAELSAESLKTWRSALTGQKVEVFLPRFKTTAQFSLSRVLKAMGMVDAFDPAAADFSGMDGKTHSLFISEVVHKAFVDVNEKGTEAAAATAVIMELAMAPGSPPPVFRADHPFLFIIHDTTTGAILFMGRLTDPLPAS